MCSDYTLFKSLYLPFIAVNSPLSLHIPFQGSWLALFCDPVGLSVIIYLEVSIIT